MKLSRNRVFLVVMVVLTALLLMWAAGCSQHRRVARSSHNGRVRVVTTTSLLQCAVEEIGGRHVEVSVLIAPGSCPGHYDIRPQDMDTVSKCHALFTHGYEGFIPNLINSLGSHKPKQVTIHANGNWMVPSIYVHALGEVTDALCTLNPAHSGDYRKSLTELKSRYQRLDADQKLKFKASGIAGTPVLCSDQQAEVAKWMGLDIVDTYPRTEELTPVLLHYMTDLGRKKKVRLCIDNLQSSPTAGEGLAKDIGAVHVILSSFPGGFGGTDTWSKCVQDNVNRVIAGLGRK